ncbi:VCBS repeat-containing protein, partial [Akkermansiaceae bacterium]|nr:VCBS repeat-containing protein [Akkermansiaceae bacterium]
MSLKPSNNLRRSCVGIVANSVVITVCDLSRVIGEYIRIIAYPIIISISCFFGGGSIVIYRNNGNGSFTELNNRFPGSSAALVSNVVGSDLDNDGDIDVVVGSSGFSSGGVRVYRNNGNLSFTRTFDNGNAPGLWDIHLADLNGDNRPEIMFSLGGSFDQIGVYVNSGNLSSWGNLIPVKSGTNTGDEPRSIHAADIDGDGDVDVMSVNYLSNQLSYYPNGGPQQVRHVTSASQTRGPRNLRTGDINGDGVLDM